LLLSKAKHSFAGALNLKFPAYQPGLWKPGA
jgi:hypothetical protein